MIPSVPLQTEIAEIKNLPKIRIPSDNGSFGPAKCKSPVAAYRANSVMMSFSQTKFKKNSLPVLTVDKGIETPRKDFQASRPIQRGGTTMKSQKM